jgi:hypothetical protein
MEQEKVEQVKKPFYKKTWFIVLAIFFGVGLIGSIFDNTPAPEPITSAPSQPIPTQPVQQAITTQTTSKDDALKEFNKLMDLSKKSGLVKSYEMGQNTSLVIYVGNVWYSQEVQFKKDMIAKFSMLEQSIYGRHRLEVRDAYSNEKLAEVTAFSASLEVYK